VPEDLSAKPITAFVPIRHGGAEGYMIFSGVGASNGTFSIPNVPRGFYLLQVGTFYLWTQESVVNLDTFRDFRADRVSVFAPDGRSLIIWPT
jgi:hypothetical protein